MGEQIYLTKVIKANGPDYGNLDAVVEGLKSGMVSVIPTETVYGLAANAFDENAVKKVFLAKGRQTDNPLIVHVSSPEMLRTVSSDIPEAYKLVIEKFFPGPLTIILRKSEKISYSVTGGLETVAVRMPEHPVARHIIDKACIPLAMPSANKSGGPSPTTFEHAFDDMNGLVPFIVDGGHSIYGLESTVINLLETPPLLLRQGVITLETLRKYIPEIREYKWTGGVALSPGIKYKHYAPKAKIILIDTLCHDEAKSLIILVVDLIRSHSAPFGLFETFPIGIENIEHKFSCQTSVNEIAASLFRGIRYLDSLKVKYILFPFIDTSNCGAAVMDRIRRATSFSIQRKEDLSIIESDLNVVCE